MNGDMQKSVFHEGNELFRVITRYDGETFTKYFENGVEFDPQTRKLEERIERMKTRNQD